MNSTRVHQVQGTINLNIEPPDRGNLMTSDEDVMAHDLGVAIFQKFSLKKGLKKFGTHGEKAVVKELSRMHDLGTCVPKHTEELSAELRQQALNLLVFLVKK